MVVNTNNADHVDLMVKTERLNITFKSRCWPRAPTTQPPKALNSRGNHQYYSASHRRHCASDSLWQVPALSGSGSRTKQVGQLLLAARVLWQVPVPNSSSSRTDKWISSASFFLLKSIAFQRLLHHLRHFENKIVHFLAKEITKTKDFGSHVILNDLI